MATGDQGDKEEKPAAILCGSEAAFENICQPCQNDGKILEAVGCCLDCQENLCPECFRCHTRPSVTRNHHVVSTEFKKDVKFKATFVFKDKCTEKCKKHGEKRINYFCPLHDYLGCSVCITMNHRECKDIEYIPEASKTFADSSVYKEYKKRLEDVQKQSEKFTDHLKIKEDVNGKACCEAVEAVKKARKEINCALNKIETDTIQNIERSKTEQKRKISDFKGKCEELYQKTSDELKGLEMLHEKNQLCNVYVAVRKGLGQVSGLEEMLGKNIQSSALVKKFKFYPNQALLKKVKNATNIGRIDTKVEHIGDVNFASVCMQASCCLISGCVILQNNKLAAVDSPHCLLRIIDQFENTVISQMTLESQPWSVAKVSDLQVVITLTRSKKIVFVRTEPNPAVVKAIKVNDCCYGVACFDEILIVTFAESNTVKILDFNGHVLRIFERDKLGQPMFFCPRHVALNSDHGIMYVSNTYTSSVVCMTLSGELKGVYRSDDLEGPSQIAVRKDGLIYICGRFSHNVHHVTFDCRKVEVIASQSEGIYNPLSVSYCETTDRLYIGMAYNRIRVYQL